MEVESDEFDGFAEALAGWDRRAGFVWVTGVVPVVVARWVAAVRRASFDRLRMKIGVRKRG